LSFLAGHIAVVYETLMCAGGNTYSAEWFAVYFKVVACIN